MAAPIVAVRRRKENMTEFEDQIRAADGQLPRFHFVSAGDLCLEPRPTKWLIKHYLDAGSLGCLFGEPGAMKSFLGIDMGLCIAARQDWHEIPVRMHGPVFYIAGEGHGGIRRRTRAWSIYHGIDLQGVPFFVSDRPARFLDAEGAAEVTQAVEDLVLEHGEPVLIIIDTLNRNFGPGDENSTSDMTSFISTIDEHLRCRYQCAVLIIHHSGLATTERARGASALRASLDWEYRMSKNADGARILTCTKTKDHTEPPALAFIPEEITLDGWTDPDDGEVMTSCVLCMTEATPDKKPLKGNTKIAFDALVSLGVYSHIDAWRDAAYSSGISATSSREAKKKAFQRAVRDLLDAGYVETEDDYYWPKGTETTGGHWGDMSRGIGGQPGHTPLGVSRVPPLVQGGGVQ